MKDVAASWPIWAHSIVESHRRIFPGSQAESFEVAGATVLYVSPTSPFTQIIGFGIKQPVIPADLAFLRKYFAERNTPLRIRTTPFTDPSVFACLGRSAFKAWDFNFFLVRDGAPSRLDPSPRIEIGPLSDEELFVRTFCDAHFEGASGYDEVELARTLFHASGCVILGAWINGELAGAAILAMFDGLATFIAGCTLPRFRRLGVQRALIQRRIDLAVAKGARLLVSRVSPGSSSHGNYIAQGFRIGYNTMLMEELK